MNTEKKGTIMIVDDEPDLLKVFSKRLRGEGYDVITYDNPLEGFVRVQETQPDLIILDVMMPQMDGLELKTRLSEDPLLSQIPVIFLTARNTIPDKIRGLRLGADDYVTKPFESEELLVRVESAIKRRRFYENVAVTDSLTGLANLFVFKKEFTTFFAMAKRYGRVFSLAVMDVDHLKRFNDRYGHSAGDELLKTFTRVMKKVFRESDVLIRYAGDEFVVLMPETGQEEAERVIKRLNEETRQCGVVLAEEPAAVSFSVSIGLTTWDGSTHTEKELFDLADRKMYENKAQSKSESKCRSRKMVLLIEDEPDIRKTITYALRHTGFEVVAAHDGREGLKLALELNPDMIILDLMLPNLKGEDICKAVREHEDENLSSIPIIMLSAKNQDADRVIGKVIGANAYMTKPFNMEELLTKTQSFIGVS